MTSAAKVRIEQAADRPPSPRHPALCREKRVLFMPHIAAEGFELQGGRCPAMGRKQQ